MCSARRETRPSARPRSPSAGARARFAGRAEGRTEQQPCSLLRSGDTRAPPPSSSEPLPAASSRQQRWPALAAAAAAPQPARLPCARGPPSRLPGIRDNAEAPAPPLPPQQTPAPLQTPPAAPASPLRAARPAHRPSRPGLAAPEVILARQKVLPDPPLATARGAALLRAARGRLRGPWRRAGGLRRRVPPLRPLGFMLPPSRPGCGRL